MTGRRAASILVLTGLAALGAPPGASGATVVSGQDDVNAPLELAPTGGGNDQMIGLGYYTGAPVGHIQAMPTDRLVNRVTVGDLAAADPGCTYTLTVSEYTGGNWTTTGRNGGQSGSKPLPTTPGRVTFEMERPFTMRGGNSYLLTLRATGGSCYSVTLRTWEHAGSKLNGGASLERATRCQPIDAGKTDTYDGYRMWHQQGENDAVPCPGDTVPYDFDPSMPTGWLSVKPLNVPHIETDTNPQPTCGSTVPTFGIAAVPWTDRHVCQIASFSPPNDPQPNGWYWGLRASYPDGGAPRDTYLKFGLDGADLAKVFKPHIAFDSSEKWFPLSLDRFLLESNAGTPVHSQCHYQSVPNSPPTRICSPLSDPGQIRAGAFDDAGAFIDIAGDAGDRSTYRTTDQSCLVGNRQDCTGGDASQIYWRVTNGSLLNPYRFVQYWMFYRYNEFPDAAGGFNHEGDWEAFAVAPSAREPSTFDYASFSGHGHWFSYLRDNLRCADAYPVGEPYCGTEQNPSYSRIKVYVANGSHANYPQPCSEQVPDVSCQQADGNILKPEKGHDGAQEWGHNSPYWNTHTSDGLAPLPTAPSSWTFWPGKWGSDESPASPGTQSLYNQSSELCARGNDNCPQPIAAAASRRSIRTRGAIDTTCPTWFGPGVAALACANATLKQTVRQRLLGKDGSLRLTLKRAAKQRRRERSSATASGIAQLMGQPLKAGDRLHVRGRLPSGTTVLVRISSGQQTRSLRITPTSGQHPLDLKAVRVRGRVTLKDMRAGRRVTVRLREWRP